MSVNFAIKAAAQIDNPTADTLKALQGFASGLGLLSKTNWSDLGTQAASAYKLMQDEIDARDAAANAVAQANDQLIALNDKMQTVKKDILDSQIKAKADADAQLAEIDKYRSDSEVSIGHKNDALKAREDGVSAREQAVLDRENAALDKERQLETKSTSIANQQTVIDGVKSDLAARMTAVEQREQKLLNN